MDNSRDFELAAKLLLGKATPAEEQEARWRAEVERKRVRSDRLPKPPDPLQTPEKGAR